MQEEIQKALDHMCDPKESDAYHYADKVGAMADEETKGVLLNLVRGEDWEVAYLACRALSKTSWNDHF